MTEPTGTLRDLISLDWNDEEDLEKEILESIEACEEEFEYE